MEAAAAELYQKVVFSRGYGNIVERDLEFLLTESVKSNAEAEDHTKHICDIMESKLSGVSKATLWTVFSSLQRLEKEHVRDNM